MAIRWIFTPPYYWQQLIRQIIDIGYFSLPVVGLTTLFSGMVLALQSYTGFARFSAEDTVATVVVLSADSTTTVATVSSAEKRAKPV